MLFRFKWKLKLRKLFNQKKKFKYNSRPWALFLAEAMVHAKLLHGREKKVIIEGLTSLLPQGGRRAGPFNHVKAQIGGCLFV